jgi:hypothetical protein
LNGILGENHNGRFCPLDGLDNFTAPFTATLNVDPVYPYLNPVAFKARPQGINKLRIPSRVAKKYVTHATVLEDLLMKMIF